MGPYAKIPGLGFETQIEKKSDDLSKIRDMRKRNKTGMNSTYQLCTFDRKIETLGARTCPIPVRQRSGTVSWVAGLRD